MTTGQLIKSARKKAGITQAELADRLGIPYQSVSQWERDTRNPKYDSLKRIAAALGVEWTELVPVEQQEKTVVNHIREKLGDMQDVPETSENNMSKDQESLAEITAIWARIAGILRYVKKNAPEEFAKAGISISEVDEDIERAEDWEEILTSILIMGGFSTEGAKKVLTYAEDILPRYQREPETPPQALPREKGDTTPKE